MTKTIMTCVRNEAPFLLEWIAYHRAIGFERFVVFSNDCSDGTEQILDALAAHEVVEHIPQTVPKGSSPQGYAAETARRDELLDTGDWAIFLDADEFLNVTVGSGTVDDLTDYISARNSIGMLINWRVFGDSYQDRFQGRMISRDYTRCETGLKTTQFKTLFLKNSETADISRYLHLCDLEPGKSDLSRFLAPHGDVMSMERWTTTERQRRWLDEWTKLGTSPFGTINGNFREYPIAQINHYMVRDRYSFHLKKERGRGYTATTAKPRHTDEFFRRWNRNETDDISILRWEESTGRQIEQLIALCGLHELVAKVAADYETGYQAFKDHDRDQFPLTLPPLERHFVRQAYADAEAVLEYGSGGSTVLAARMGTPVISVESSMDWAVTLQEELNKMQSRHAMTKVVHVDIGPTKKWGYPVNNAKFANYWAYPLEPWLRHAELNPDTVLIDGRMRTACFVATLAMTKRDVRILFDDYGDRKVYHRVERFLKPTEMVGRMAIFDARPGLLNIQDFAEFVPMLFSLR